VIAAVNKISAAISEQNTATQTIAQGVEAIAQKAEAACRQSAAETTDAQAAASLQISCAGSVSGADFFGKRKAGAKSSQL
jgi:hypothetical protein